MEGSCEIVKKKQSWTAATGGYLFWVLGLKMTASFSKILYYYKL